MANVHELVAAPFLGKLSCCIRGRPAGCADKLAAAPVRAVCPPWLAHTARQAFSVDIAGRALADVVLVRQPSPLGYSRASYEVNMGCNWDFIWI